METTTITFKVLATTINIKVTIITIIITIVIKEVTTTITIVIKVEVVRIMIMELITINALNSQDLLSIMQEVKSTSKDSSKLNNMQILQTQKKLVPVERHVFLNMFLFLQDVTKVILYK